VEEAEKALYGMYAMLGIHPGCRSGHAKGTLCTGTFTPSERAHELTDAPHMKEQTVDVTVRFSNQTGDPDRHDGAKHQIRGMATRFHLPGGRYTDLVTISLPCFSNRTPGDFIEMNRACFKRKKNKRSGKHKTKFRLVKMPLFLLRHRESVRTFVATFRAKPIPSYANCRYNSLNAFMWSSDKFRGYVRYSWMPEDGQRTLKGAKKLPPDFLQRDLYDRLGRRPPRPIRFWLEVQLATKEDLRRHRVDDPTRIWPKQEGKPGEPGPVPALHDKPLAQFRTVGVLELTSLMDEEPEGGVPAFNPLNLTEGIDISGDPILEFRKNVYELAAYQRTSGDYPEEL
jgi:catalase